MPQIKVKIPGFSEDIQIDAKGFAAEDTLEKLVNHLTNQAGGAAKKAKELNKELENSTDAFSHLDEEIINLADDVEETGLDLSRFGKASRSAADTVRTMGDSLSHLADTADSGTIKMSSFVGQIKTMAVDFLDSINQIGDAFGPLGKAVTGLATGVASIAVKVGAAVAGFVFGQLEALREQQKALFDSGVYFARGIDDAAELAGEAGTTIGTLGKAAAESSVQLRRFDGGAAAGLRRVTKAFANVDDSSRTLLYSMGYTQDEILTGIADFSQGLQASGRSMTDKELAEASTKYLSNLSELNRLTGTDVKQRRAAAEQLQREASFQAYLNGLDQTQANIIKQTIASLPEGMKEVAKAQLLGVQIQDSALAYIQANSQGTGAIMADLDARAKAGTLTLEESNKIIGDLGKTTNQELSSIRDSLGDYKTLYYLQNASGSAAKIVEYLGPAIDDSKQIAAAASETAERFDPDKVRKGFDDNVTTLNEAIGKLTSVEATVTNKFQQAAISLTQTALHFGDTVNDVIVQLRRLSGESNIPLTAGEQASALRQQIESNTGFLGMGGGNATFGAGQRDPYAGLSDQQLAEAGIVRTQRSRIGIGGPETRYEMAQPQPRALGGAVASGQSYLVGETGQEIFRPSQDGQIIPTGSPIPVKIDASAFRDMNDRLDLLARINGAMLSALESNNRLTRQGIQLAT